MAIAASALVLASALTAQADEPGACPGVDLVETNLTKGTSSGYYIPGLKLIILNRAILANYAPSVQHFILAHECAHADPAVGAPTDQYEDSDGDAHGQLGGTPTVALALSVGTALALIWSGTFNSLLNFCALLFVLQYTVSFISLFVLRARERPEAAGLTLVDESEPEPAAAGPGHANTGGNAGLPLTSNVRIA